MELVGSSAFGLSSADPVGSRTFEGSVANWAPSAASRKARPSRSSLMVAAGPEIGWAKRIEVCKGGLLGGTCSRLTMALTMQLHCPANPLPF